MRSFIIIIALALGACGGPTMTKEEQQQHWVKNHEAIIAGVDAFLAVGEVAAAKQMLAELPDAAGPKMRKLRKRLKDAAAKAKQEENIFYTANGICREMVKKSAKYPSKADFDWGARGNYKARVTGGGVELMNAYGAMIPHTYACQFDDAGNITNFDMKEGSL